MDPIGLYKVKGDKVGERLERQHETVSRRVMMEWIRISGIPLKSNENKTPIELGKLLVDAIKYKYKDITEVIMWPTFAGKDLKKGTTAIRAKIPYSFWWFFTQEGGKKLGEYNKTNQTEIRLTKDKSVLQADAENLGMLMRKTIKAEYVKIGKPNVDVRFKRGKIQIAGHQEMNAPLMTVLLGLNIDSWEGVPVCELLTNSDQSKLKRGEIKWGQDYEKYFGQNQNPPTVQESDEGGSNEGGETSTSGVGANENPHLKRGRGTVTSGSEDEDEEGPEKKKQTV